MRDRERGGGGGREREGKRGDRRRGELTRWAFCSFDVYDERERERDGITRDRRIVE